MVVGSGSVLKKEASQAFISTKEIQHWEMGHFKRCWQGCRWGGRESVGRVDWASGKESQSPA